MKRHVVHAEFHANSGIVSTQVEARADVDVPEFLIPESELNHKLAQQQPRYVPIDGLSSSASVAEVMANENNYEDPSQGILQLKLSNGICINARRTLNEPKAAMLRMVAAGGGRLCVLVFHTTYGIRDWLMFMLCLGTCTEP